MKQLIAIVALFLASITGYSQNVRKDSAGNYVAISAVKIEDKPNGKTYTDSKGVVYPVYESAKGKLYVVRKSKTGNEYRLYLKTE